MGAMIIPALGLEPLAAHSSALGPIEGRDRAAAGAL